MGLDNGICIRRKGEKLFLDLDTFLENEREANGSDDCSYYADMRGDLCYWRKCWGFRNAVMDYLENKYDRRDEEDYVLDLDDLQEIAAILLKMIQNPDLWTDSIWTWKEVLNTNIQNYGNILHFIKDIKDKEIDLHTTEAVWYDSY